MDFETGIVLLKRDTEEAGNVTKVAVEEQQDEEIVDVPDDADKYAADYCADAPSGWHKRMCQQLYRWDKNARDAPPVTDKVVLPPAIPGMPAPELAGDLAPVPANSDQCMDLGCVCQYIGGDGAPGSNECKMKGQNGQNGGEPLRKAVRKEYRQLSDEERAKYHAALKTLKASKEYDRLAAIHKAVDNSGAAHSGPAFLPWHREYLKRYEIRLRQIDPTLALPYWDSTLDGHLPTPEDSILFTETFAGETDKNGNIVKGDFVNWKTFDGDRNLRRRVGERDEDGKYVGTLPTEEGVQSFINHDKMEIMMGFSAAQHSCPFYAIRYNVFEYFHGGAHMFVGGNDGDMGDISSASNDPLFWMHHNFMDHIYELWRKRLSPKKRESNYPLDDVQCSSAMHFSAAPMHPFQPWQNIDGLVNKYTDNLYEFSPRPSCSMGADCGSKYLFCDRSHGTPRCASKVRPGGNCAGYTNGEAICLNGECQGGKCVKKAPAPTTAKPPPMTMAPIEISCYNEHECCGKWATDGQCNSNSDYMNQYCKASCKKCKYSYNMNEECNDRHSNCKNLAAEGGCDTNWMAENCRKHCNKCNTKRGKVCSGDSPGEKAPSYDCKSSQCFNENICCQVWAMSGGCKKNSAWMNCNCKVSCGQCIPKNYQFGTCRDYHPKCFKWAKKGECKSNGWILSNCRRSCQSCANIWHIKKMCANGRGQRSVDDHNLWTDAMEENADDFSSGMLLPRDAEQEQKQDKLEQKQDQLEMKKELNSSAVVMMLNVDAVEKAMEASSTSGMGPLGPPKGHSKGVSAYVGHSEDLPQSGGMPADD
uniref:ShKT domain-containing protein n=1 Tax=Globodera rostochiensis TaxID=31243 RepID=A0A914HRA4_GLORO